MTLQEKYDQLQEDSFNLGLKYLKETADHQDTLRQLDLYNKVMKEVGDRIERISQLVPTLYTRREVLDILKRALEEIVHLDEMEEWMDENYPPKNQTNENSAGSDVNDNSWMQEPTSM